MKKVLILTTLTICVFVTTAQTDTKGCVIETSGFKNGLGTISFVSSKTWKVGNQIWSDAVTATKCQKTTYHGGELYEKKNADCRTNPGYPGDLFSWCAVYLFQEQLCPAPWRVPTMVDFFILDNALGGTGKSQQSNSLQERYLNNWGATYAGWCDTKGRLSYQDFVALYWSLSEQDTEAAFNLQFENFENYVHPQRPGLKYVGLTLRCIRDN